MHFNALPLSRFCKEHQELLALPDIPRKVLDAARNAEDPMIFYSVFRFFERAVLIAAPMTEGIWRVSYESLNSHWLDAERVVLLLVDLIFRWVLDPKFRPYAEHFVNLFGPGSLIVANR